MDTRIVTIELCALVLVGCEDRRSEGPWHEPLPTIIVALKDSADVSVAPVGLAPAPEIQFPALLQPDPSHMRPVLARTTGVITRIAAPREARSGDTLAILGQGSEHGGPGSAVAADYAGRWQPRRQAGQLVWQGETLGLLQERGFWWAIGAASDYDARFVHLDDPATVVFDGERDSRPRGYAGRVESVTRARPFYSSDVAVEFRMPGATIPPGGPITVIVRPSGAEDSLATVPAAAVVQLPPGTAVFTPLGAGRYAVKWVVAGPAENGKIVVREGVRRGESVVIQGLVPLVQAARDSLDRLGPIAK